MTSSENLRCGIEPWSIRSAFAADSWLSEAFARDTETITKALQKSLSSNNYNNNDHINHVSEALISPETPTVSNVSGSEPETLSKRRRTAVAGPNAGKITKRKPRASKKKTQTTFITADPANFRQMVQQVTGVRFGGTPVLKPEPQRPGGGRSSLIIGGGGGGGCLLPTLDTSSFLLGQQQQMGPAGVVVGSGHFDFEAALVCDGGAASSSGLDFGALSNFPTLESWN